MDMNDDLDTLETRKWMDFLHAVQQHRGPGRTHYIVNRLVGGHIAGFQSAATLYDIGFGHFWHAPTDAHGGDLIYIQGPYSPGICARAFVEGRLTEAQLLGYRHETEGTLRRILNRTALAAVPSASKRG
jgi:pyruvate dehydrogenase complex dehydrogenase (E1) component